MAELDQQTEEAQAEAQAEAGLDYDGVRIPSLDFEIPPQTQQGEITTVEVNLLIRKMPSLIIKSFDDLQMPPSVDGAGKLKLSH